MLENRHSLNCLVIGQSLSKPFIFASHVSLDCKVRALRVGQVLMVAGVGLQMRETEGDSDFDEALMGMSPDTSFSSPKLPQQYHASRFAPETPLPPSQAHAFRGRNLQNSTMISDTQK